MEKNHRRRLLMNATSKLQNLKYFSHKFGKMFQFGNYVVKMHVMNKNRMNRNIAYF